MNLIYIFLGMNIHFLFLFKRDWLFKKEFYIKLLLCNSILALLSYLFQYCLIGNPKFVIALKMPLISQVLFIGLVVVFQKLFKRNPIDTFWSMDISQMKDGIFNFGFWFLSIVIPAILVFKKII
jgi:hypothetical protein